MKICRFEAQDGGADRIGVVSNEGIRDVSSVLAQLPTVRWPLPSGDLLIAHLQRLRPKMEELACVATPIPLASVRLKTPIANPGKILCGIGNFPEIFDKGREPGQFGMFIKPTSALSGPQDDVVLRWPERTTFHEVELAIIIGKGGVGISAAHALEHVAGYAIGLDMTLQGEERISFNKSFDTYGVVGPWMVTADEIPDPSVMTFWLKVNGEVRQQDSIGRLVYNVALLVEHAASVMTLVPGDVIMSGTPPLTTGPVVPGDVMHAHMDLIGDMTVAVRAGPGRSVAANQVALAKERSLASV
jgi:2,4-didehydro-3-deoxy-L-rhamnonate hydrolase